MKWWRIALFALLPALSAGCAAAPPATPAQAPKKQSALDTARALRKQAEALHAPIYHGPDNKTQKARFLAGPLRAWVVKRMQLHRKAQGAYSDAVNQAPNPSSELVALDELGEMELSLANEFVAAGMAAMPGEYKKERGMAQTFEHALRGAVAPRVESARKDFKECRSVAKAAKLSTPASARCKEQLAALPPPVVAQAVAPPASQPRGLPVPDRPLVASRQSKPCVFSGTLETFAELDDAQGTPVAVIDDTPGIELSSLELPADRSKAVRVAVSWPLRFSGTLARGSLPLVTEERLDLVKGHIWLRKGAPVTAFQASGGRATAYRDFRDGNARSKTKPAELSRRVTCAELSLDQGQDRDQDDVNTNGKQHVFLAGLVPLFAAPGAAKPIGQIDVPRQVVSGGQLVERHGDFARVRGEEGFSFDAWVPASALVGGGLGIGRPGRGRYTHVARQRVPLRLLPNTSAPVVAELARGAYVVVGPLDSGFVPVRVSGVYARNRSRAFYIDASDLPELAPAKR